MVEENLINAFSMLDTNEKRNQISSEIEKLGLLLDTVHNEYNIEKLPSSIYNYNKVEDKNMTNDEYFTKMYESIIYLRKDILSLVNTLMIIKISKDGSIKKTAFYDNIPTVTYGPDPDGMDEAFPIAFIGERDGLFYYIDAELKECEYAFKEISIRTHFSGEAVTERKVNGVLAEYFVGKKSRARSSSLNDLL